MLRKTMHTTIVLAVGLALSAGVASADEFFLLTGVDAGFNPDVPRPVFPTVGPAPGTFNDGDRLGGDAPPGTAVSWQGTGTPLRPGPACGAAR